MADERRLLVIAPVTIDGAALRQEIERRNGDRPARVHLVVPAVTESKFKAAFGDVDDAIGEAQTRLEQEIDGLRGGRLEATGQIGDNDPLIAAEDALGGFDADEILVVTHRGEEEHWFEHDLFERAADRLEPPVVHVEMQGARRLVETERAGPGRHGHEPGSDEVELTENLPPFSKRDLLGIVVAIAGTIVLAILAASAESDSTQFAARVLIAIAFALINLAHVVGLVFFSAQGYRGLGERLFGNLSLLGTPLAIVVSLLI